MAEHSTRNLPAPETKRKKLPQPATVRFQVSIRGVVFKTLAKAREDFEAWLQSGESPSGAEISVHIWQNGHERVLEEIADNPGGRTLRRVIRSALQSGKLQIRKTRKN